jgi:DNA invertase Pin-like site-specific DNA recombinase
MNFLTDLKRNIIDNDEKSNKKQKINAIIYCRISSLKQNEGLSLKSQELYCQEYCNNNKFNVINTITEIKSAKIMNKQKKLNELIINDNFVLIVYDQSRLSRNISDFINFSEKCKKQNVVIHFVQNELVSSNVSDLKKIISGVIDGEIESKNIGLRVKRSIEYRKRLGIYKSTISKYGYKNIKINNIITSNINFEEQKIIKLIEKLYWGSNGVSIDILLYEITGIKHSLYNIKDPTDNVETLEHGNMKLIDIANFLNSISIFKRTKKWSSRTIKNIINQNYINMTNLNIKN